MTRTVMLTGRFRRALDRLGVIGEPERQREVARTIATLARTESLPTAHDTEVVIPPTLHAFVRRVQGRNLWLWYVATASELRCIHLSSDPPVPME